jgi:hypothetical protein
MQREHTTVAHTIFTLLKIINYNTVYIFDPFLLDAQTAIVRDLVGNLLCIQNHKTPNESLSFFFGPVGE